MLIIRQGENGGQLVREMIDDELPAKLAIQSTQASSHQRGQVTFHNPLLESHRVGRRLNNVEQSRPRKVANPALVLNVVHQYVEQGEVLLLGPAGEPLTVIKASVVMLRELLRLEPDVEDARLESDLRRDVEGELDDLGLGVMAEPNAILARDAHEEVRQT